MNINKALLALALGVALAACREQEESPPQDEEVPSPGDNPSSPAAPQDAP